MKNIILMLLVAFLILTPSISLFASEEHDHDHDETEHHEESAKPVNEKHEKDNHQEHQEKHDDHEDSHGHGHEENERIGEGKGIVEYNEKEGFRLSPEATKNFSLKTQTLFGKGPWTLPLSAVLYSGEEVNLYRLREGHVKRIDFKIQRKTKETLVVSSSDLTVGDQVAIDGVGFLRIAELAATGQTPDGHAH